MTDRITLAHGNGGRFMRALIDEVLAPALGPVAPDTRLDAAPFTAAAPHGLVVTTDGFTVQPLEFPGGDLGSLAVHGTVNDLAVAGATPLALTLGAVIEEGIETELLRRLFASFGRAAAEAGGAAGAVAVREAMASRQVRPPSPREASPPRRRARRSTGPRTRARS